MEGREIVATGSWLYADVVMPVFVVRLDYDFWYEVAREEGTLSADEEPFLDSAGHAYYVSFKVLRNDASFWPDSGPHRSLDEARITAESRVSSPITWQSGESLP
ncbi:hypothetical protein ACFYT3_27095 [Nocardia amikacinitolerans]|uniref:hypothetical protein n=1 Tax=Nocardia amikacinitolerans TaxID=756689 RepID=UPI0020A3E019|nr:hypothetical protein [Nocardia amikacinitolerans]MCP2289844.1 hypothetical protein [Nocardia amikacinitolerans]